MTYLQELHNLGLANADHTTLLLNAYTKLKDVARLDRFVKTEARRTGDPDADADELPFDLDTAIRVCRQAGYFQHASYLAKRYARHEDYLQIVVEDVGDYAEALAYLRRLGSEAAESNLARYGRAMLDNIPDETTDLLIDICTSLVPLEQDDEPRPQPSRQSSVSGPSYLSYLALNRAPAPPESVQPSSASTAATVKAQSTTNTVKPTTQRREASVASGSNTPPSQPSRSETPTLSKRTITVKRPSPRIYFAHFIDHPAHFLRFLETVAHRRWGQALAESAVPAVIEPDPNADPAAEARDQAAVWNTLLELYLSSADRTDKALQLLRSVELPYDPTHALILCSTRGFTPGLVLLWERLAMYEDVLRFHIDREREDPRSGASADVVRCLDEYGAAHPALYPLVLRFLTSDSELLARHTDDLARVLEHVERERIMPPLAVVQVLSRNGVASVGLVKKWLMGQIKSAREEIETVRLLSFGLSYFISEVEC